MDLLDFCCIFFSRDVYIGFRLKKKKLENYMNALSIHYIKAFQIIKK